jgi:hypothetical protein
MTPPPILPPSPPPVLAPKATKIPTFVYATLFVLLFTIRAVWAFLAAIARVHNDAPVGVNASYAFGMVVGGVFFPLLLIVGIASIWKVNRGFRGVVRVLFWASLFLYVPKILQFLNP